MEDAVRRHLDKGRPGAMSAIGIAVNHFLRGDGVVGSGWVGRAQRLLRDEPEGPEHGYALYLEQEAALAASGTAAVAAMAGRVRELGRRFADPNLVAGGDLFEGRALTVSWPRAARASAPPGASSGRGPCWPRPASVTPPSTRRPATAHRRVRDLPAAGLTAQAGAGPAERASTWTPTWRLSRPRMAEMPRRRRGEITRSRPRAV